MAKPVIENEFIPQDIVALMTAFSGRFRNEGEMQLPFVMKTLRHECYKTAYRNANGNQAKASRILGVQVSTAARYFERHGHY